MTFKPALWYPIAVLLTVANVVGVWFATSPTPPWHATIHAGLAVAAGLWARRLRQARGGSQGRVGREAAEALDALEALEFETTKLRQELSEAQDRLDFAERRLAQGVEPRRGEPLR